MSTGRLADCRNTSGDDSLPAGPHNRAMLFADLEAACAAGCAPKIFVIFELIGLNRYTDNFGSAETERLLTGLVTRLTLAVGSSGTCYTLRGAEFCALVDDPISGRPSLLDKLTAAVAETVGGHEIGAVVGAVVIPDEVSDAPGAISLADERLNLQKRNRGWEPQPILESASSNETRPSTTPGRGAVSFFRGYENVGSGYRA